MIPRERVAEYLSTEPGVIPLSIERDMRAILAANAGYEKMARDAAREAVAEYKRELAYELRQRSLGLVPTGDAARDNGYATALDAIADDLEDGTL